MKLEQTSRQEGAATREELKQSRQHPIPLVISLLTLLEKVYNHFPFTSVGLRAVVSSVVYLTIPRVVRVKTRSSDNPKSMKSEDIPLLGLENQDFNRSEGQGHLREEAGGS